MLLAEKIRQIKYARLKPEERYLINVFDNIIITKDYENNYIYEYNDIKLFKYNKIRNILYIDFTHCWQKLYDKFKITGKDIYSLYKKYLLEYF